MLVNASHPLPEDYAPELQQVEDKDGRTYQLDVCCAQAFWDMMADCAAAGGEPYICSGFRLRRDQEELYQDKIKRLVKEGVDPEEAPEEAAKTVAVPGTSEHESGLAADLIDESYPYLDELQEQTPTQKWLMANSWRYGFILRYPNGTTEQTGIIYEPWHYRYVGQPYAEEIHRMGLTLEEYRGPGGPIKSSGPAGDISEKDPSYRETGLSALFPQRGLHRGPGEPAGTFLIILNSGG